MKAADWGWSLLVHTRGAGYDSEKSIRDKRYQMVEHWSCGVVEFEPGTSRSSGHALFLKIIPSPLQILADFTLPSSNASWGPAASLAQKLVRDCSRCVLRQPQSVSLLKPHPVDLCSFQLQEFWRTQWKTLITIRLINNNPYVHLTLCTFINCLLLLISTTSKYQSDAAEAVIQELIIG